MRSSEIGGQAVIEGVMMKNKNKYAVAVRKPDKEIAVDVKTSGSKEHSKLLKLPIIRGVVAFIDSMVVGIQTLSFSASFFEDEEEEKKAEKKKSDKNKKNSKKSVKKENVITSYSIHYTKLYESIIASEGIKMLLSDIFFHGIAHQ